MKEVQTICDKIGTHLPSFGVGDTICLACKKDISEYLESIKIKEDKP
jgi:hypothetical protein